MPKLNSIIIDRINKIADKLPKYKFETPLFMVITGAMAKSMKLENSEKLDNKKVYEVCYKSEVEVDHKEMLRKVYEQKGWQGVDLYGIGILHSHGLLPSGTLETLRKKISECG